jgi:sugar lactone lactonase YvrE
VIDGKSYKVVKTFKTPTHPNSLALSADGKTLYVSVKQNPAVRKKRPSRMTLSASRCKPD